MTQPRATTRRTALEKRRELVLADLIDGMKAADVARKYKVERSSVTRFAHKYKAELTAMSLKVEKAVEDYAIASKAHRIGELARLYDDVTAWIGEHGYTESTVRYDRDGNEVGRTERLRADALAQIRGLLADAALELGHRSTKGDTNMIAGVINIIRGGTPLGMAPQDVAIDAAYTVAEPESLAPSD